jgi:hypothetical protein
MTELYDLSVGISVCVLSATIAGMEKGAVYFEEQGSMPMIFSRCASPRIWRHFHSR